MFVPDYPFETRDETPADATAFDRIVSVAWTVSEIAFDVFTMLFWSAIGLFVARWLL